MTEEFGAVSQYCQQSITTFVDSSCLKRPAKGPASMLALSCLPLDIGVPVPYCFIPECSVVDPEYCCYGSGSFM